MHVWQLIPLLSTSPEMALLLRLINTKIIARLSEEKTEAEMFWNKIRQAKMMGWESKCYAFFQISVEHSLWNNIYTVNVFCVVKKPWMMWWMWDVSVLRKWKQTHSFLGKKNNYWQEKCSVTLQIKKIRVLNQFTTKIYSRNTKIPSILRHSTKIFPCTI